MQGFGSIMRAPENPRLMSFPTRPRNRPSARWLPVALALLASGPIFGADQVKVGFNRDVLPILAENCFACHGFDKDKRKAGLRLDQRDVAVADRDGIRAIVPGNLKESELWFRIESKDEEEVMPPPKTGKELTPAQRDTLRRWIEQGAAYEPHWAYVPPKAVEPRAVRGSTSPIDRFVRSRLAAEDVKPAAEADRPTLIRRLSLDLTGMPPTALEVDAYLNDARPDAYERVVQRLLASPHFGERWARWWLDLAHYADSDGYLQDFLRPVAWRYRQWVVDAFNRDLPFDRFTVEQLAGDLLPAATTSQKIATGFLRNTLSNREGGADLEEFRVKQVVDRAMTTATTWLGLTVGCAQCHDHKFDAITQREFYQLYAFFDQADEVNINAPLPGEREPWEPAKADYDRKRGELVAPLAVELAGLQAEWEQRILDAETNPNAEFAWQRALEVLGLVWGQGEGEGQLEGINIIKTPVDRRTPDERDRLLDYFLRHPPAMHQARFKELKIADLVTKLEALKKNLPRITRAPTLARTTKSRASYIHLRGDYLRRGEVVKPGTPAALPAFNSGNPADRLGLARWLVAPENPLTARVTVNRLWQELFGRGLVATSENFGVRGDRPSHPELLDWLALEFQRSWSVKDLLRVIVTSQTYRQSSQARPELAARDPSNTLLARQTRLRLSAEAVRDSALAVSGLLAPTLGGPSVRPPQPESVSKEGFDNKWDASIGADRYRRGLYTFIQRTSPFAQFVTFDLPDTSRSCTRRERSNTPLQALSLLNDPVFVEAAQALAARVRREITGSEAQRLDHAFRLTVARPPTPAESTRLLAYLKQQKDLFAADAPAARELVHDTTFEGKPADQAAWITLASVLLNLDEFINRE